MLYPSPRRLAEPGVIILFAAVPWRAVHILLDWRFLHVAS